MAVAAQKTTLDMHVKPSDPERYDDLHIEGPDSADFVGRPRLRRPGLEPNVLVGARPPQPGDQRRSSPRSAPPCRGPEGPFADLDVRAVLLAGHSQTGSVATYYIEDAHDAERRADGSPVYDGYFPSGFPYAAFHDVDVPIVQVMSDGDVSLPDFAFRPGLRGPPVPARRQRRARRSLPALRARRRRPTWAPGCRRSTTLALDGDAPEADAVTSGTMNSLPHFELFACARPPGALGRRRRRRRPAPTASTSATDGYFATDEHGNSRGGVRCAQLDVPAFDLPPEPARPDGSPELPHRRATRNRSTATQLRSLYGDTAGYVAQFERRLEELVAEGWLLEADADEMRREAERLDF